MKQASWDAANGAAAGGIVLSYLAGIDWPAVAAMLAALYTAVILAEKVMSIGSRVVRWWSDRRG